ncbi:MULTISPECIES: HNH/ENDO VII family nuclease, partial [unclassified Bartonella]|uniref:HNH/ENDO VII family nuclease n=1 Tax=unclassified Bartonella TaxID=2645622 RepID=UPI0035D04B40
RDHTIDVARAAGGVAAALAGGDVDAGADAAGNAAANNYLSSAQQAQMNKELEECPDDQCRRDVNEKWFEISEEQDRIFEIGFAKGTIVGAVKAIGNGIYATAHDVKELGLAIGNSSLDEIYQNALQGVGTAISWTVSGHVINDVSGGAGQLWEGVGQFWGGVKDSFWGHIDHIHETMEQGGDGAFSAGAESGEMAGKAVGKVAYEVGSIVLTDGVAGAAKGGVKLAGKLVEKDLIKFAAKTEEAVITGAKVGAANSEVNTAHVGKEIAQSLEKMSDEAIATQYLGQERKFWSKPIEVGFEITNNGEKITQINKVYQSEKLFDPNRISEWMVNKKKVTGTNIERMKTGRAPIGFDGRSVELHHMLQTPDGPIAEVSKTFHKKHTSIIHINPNTMESAIDRDMFGQWREKYWKERAKGYIEHEKNNLTEKNL